MLQAVEETFLGQILFGNYYICRASEKKSDFLKSQIYYIFSGGGGLCFLCCIGGGNQEFTEAVLID